MSFAWETTEQDITSVLKPHHEKQQVVSREKTLAQIHDSLDHDLIEQTVLAYADMDDQTSAAYSCIENQLIEMGIINGEKIWYSPDEEPIDTTVAIEEGFYTVVEGEGRETRINFEPHKDGGATLILPGDGPRISFDNQQLGEFGALLLTMARLDDADAVCELLEGYGATKSDYMRLYRQLVSLMDAVSDRLDCEEE